MTTWTPRFTCPDCRRPVWDGETETADCGACGRRFDRRNGIYRFLGAESEETGRFARQYRAIRARDGYRGRSGEYYRRLPVVSRDDPRAGEWRIRRESYATFERHALPAIWRGPARVADLGAGSGWLSHRLSSLGHELVAVDRFDDDDDGLGACRHYEAEFVSVQADLDGLPFAAAEFDVVVLNGSLHYSPDPAATMAEARRVLAPGGSLVVMDSPMFVRPRDGEAMVAMQLQSFARDLGLSDVVRPGIGFLTFDGLRRTSAALGLRGRFYPSRGPLGWRVRRHLGGLRLRRAPAAFGVWVAQ